MNIFFNVAPNKKNSLDFTLSKLYRVKKTGQTMTMREIIMSGNYIAKAVVPTRTRQGKDKTEYWLLSKITPTGNITGLKLTKFLYDAISAPFLEVEQKDNMTISYFRDEMPMPKNPDSTPPPASQSPSSAAPPKSPSSTPLPQPPSTPSVPQSGEGEKYKQGQIWMLDKDNFSVIKEVNGDKGSFYIRTIFHDKSKSDSIENHQQINKWLEGANSIGQLQAGQKYKNKHGFIFEIKKIDFENNQVEFIEGNALSIQQMADYIVNKGLTLVQDDKEQQTPNTPNTTNTTPQNDALHVALMREYKVTLDDLPTDVAADIKEYDQLEKDIKESLQNGDIQEKILWQIPPQYNEEMADKAISGIMVKQRNDPTEKPPQQWLDDNKIFAKDITTLYGTPEFKLFGFVGNVRKEFAVFPQTYHSVIAPFIKNVPQDYVPPILKADNNYTLQLQDIDDMLTLRVWAFIRGIDIINGVLEQLKKEIEKIKIELQNI